MIESESVRRKPSSIAVLPHKNSEIPDFTSLQYYLRAPADKKLGYKLGGVNYDYAKNIYGGKGATPHEWELSLIWRLRLKHC